jgi:hypothetical protein
MLMDLIGISFCEMEIDEERSYVSARNGDKTVGSGDCDKAGSEMALPFLFLPNANVHCVLS